MLKIRNFQFILLLGLHLKILLISHFKILVCHFKIQFAMETAWVHAGTTKILCRCWLIQL